MKILVLKIMLKVHEFPVSAASMQFRYTFASVHDPPNYPMQRLVLAAACLDHLPWNSLALLIK